MPLIIPPGYGQAVYRMKHSADSEEMVVTMGHDLSDAAGNYQAAVNRLFGNWNTSLGLYVGTSVSLLGVDLYVGTDGSGNLVFESAGVPVAGTSTGSMLPSNCAVIFRKITSLSGRRGRGRIYLPFCVTENNVSETGIISATPLADLQTGANNWWTKCNTNGGAGLPKLPMVVLHRSEGAGTEPPPTVVTSLGALNIIGTQRKRLRP